MSVKKRKIKKWQRGNALFLILIAVALFAALSYAITQSGRGGGTIGTENAMIYSGQLTQYPAGLRTTISRMIITNTSASTVKMDNTANVGVFAATGGAAALESPPAGIGGTGGDAIESGTYNTGTYVANTWGYVDVASPTTGFWAAGVGTDAVSGGDDAMAYLHNISQIVCQQVERGLTGSTTIPVQGNAAVVWTTGNGAGAAQGGANPIAAGAVNALFGTGITGVAFGCFNNNNSVTGPYDYYHVLIEQ